MATARSQAPNLPPSPPDPLPPRLSVPPDPILRQSPPSPQQLEADRLLQRAGGGGRPSQESLNLIQQALKLYQQAGDREGQLAALLRISAKYYSLYEDQQAIAFAQQAVSLAQTAKDLDREEEVSQFLIQLYRELDKKEEAIAAQQQILASVRRLGKLREIGALLDLGELHMEFQQYSAALATYQQSFDLARNLPRKDRQDYGQDYGLYRANPETASLKGLINSYTALGQMEKAKALSLPLLSRLQTSAMMKYIRDLPYFGTPADLLILEAMVKSNREIGDSIGEADILLRLGRGYQYLKQPALALEAAQQVMKLARQQTDPSLELDALDLTGQAHIRLRQFPQAIAAYQQFLTIAQTQQDEDNTSLATDLGQSQLIALYEEIGQTDKAEAIRKQRAPSRLPRPITLPKPIRSSITPVLFDRLPRSSQPLGETQPVPSSSNPSSSDNLTPIIPR